MRCWDTLKYMDTLPALAAPEHPANLRHVSAPTIKVFAYTRLSNDPQGRRADHRAQRRRIEEVVERQGWPGVAEWFHDTDRSASNEAVERSGWDALLAAVRAVKGRRRGSERSVRFFHFGQGGRPGNNSGGYCLHSSGERGEDHVGLAAIIVPL